MKNKFESVVLGGTFDKLHRGHKALLLKAFEVGNHVLIGLSSDEFVKKMRKSHEVAAYEERLKELKTFLKKQGVAYRAEIVPLNDPYGPAAVSSSIDAIIVSEETEPGAHEINVKRRAKGISSLKIVVVKMILSENNIPISTTRIRRKEVDREGRLSAHTR